MNVVERTDGLRKIRGDLKFKESSLSQDINGNNKAALFTNSREWLSYIYHFHDLGNTNVDNRVVALFSKDFANSSEWMSRPGMPFQMLKSSFP